MRRKRYLFCFLASGAMLIYALPHLQVFEEGAAGIFGISWLVLCLIVIAGNLSALLYHPRKVKGTFKGTSQRGNVQRKLKSM